jgi:riboflavin kinase/FMN adenylyltransferase
MMEIAQQRAWKASVLTFDPHPTRVVAPDRTPSLLTSPDRRVALMAEEGIEQVLILPFTRELAKLSPEEFVKRLLVDTLGARAVLVGDNFRFGHKQAGNVEVLAELGRRYGFDTEIVTAVWLRGRMVSSSAIRQLIREGNVALASRMLRRAYGVEGAVVSGRGVGSRQTVPTLNLATQAEVIPANGVYLTRTRDLDDGREWDSITNVGNRPTFGEGELTVETFLLSGMEGGTPRNIRVDFLRRVRPERKFDTPEALRGQIMKDVGAAQTWFRRARKWIAAENRLACTSS